MNQSDILRYPPVSKAPDGAPLFAVPINPFLAAEMRFNRNWPRSITEPPRKQREG